MPSVGRSGVTQTEETKHMRPRVGKRICGIKGPDAERAFHAVVAGEPLDDQPNQPQAEREHKEAAVDDEHSRHVL